MDIFRRQSQRNLLMDWLFGIRKLEDSIKNQRKMGKNSVCADLKGKLGIYY